MSIFETIADAIFSKDKNIGPNNKDSVERVVGELLDASRTLFAGDIAGCASCTTYDYRYIDNAGISKEDKITVPVLTSVLNDGVKIGDEFHLYRDPENIRIEIYKKSSLLKKKELKHIFEISYDEMKKHYFNR